MPSIKTHIFIAEKLNEKYNLEHDKFILGNVLPDKYSTSHFESHFNKSFREYDYKKLITKYKECFDKKDPIFIGYLTHLILDDYINVNFRKKFIYEGEEPIGISIPLGKMYIDIKEIFDLKHDDLNVYDQKLLDTFNFKEFNDFGILDSLPFIEENKASKEKLKNFFEDFNSKINLHNDNSNYEYIIYSEEEIDYLMESSIDHIDKKVKQLLLKK